MVQYSQFIRAIQSFKMRTAYIIIACVAMIMGLALGELGQAGYTSSYYNNAGLGGLGYGSGLGYGGFGYSGGYGGLGYSGGYGLGGGLGGFGKNSYLYGAPYAKKGGQSGSGIGIFLILILILFLFMRK